VESTHRYKSAHELVVKGETALCLSTDGRFFTIEEDGSGSSGWWALDPKRPFQRLIVFKRQAGGCSEIYTALPVKIDGPKCSAPYAGRFTVRFREGRLVGKANVTWNTFVQTDQHPFAYVDVLQPEIETNSDSKRLNQKPKRLAERLIKSIESWDCLTTKANGASFLKRPVGEYAATAIPANRALKTNRYENRMEEWEQMANLASVFLNTYLVQELDRLTDGPGALVFLLDSLDSPIEALMLFALILCAREQHLGVSVLWTHPDSKLAAGGEDRMSLSHGTRRLNLEIRPQSKVGIYRVDFVLSYFGIDFVRTEVSEAGQGDEWHEIRVDKKMVVECDGHDFHERTKEQARRDKERDRSIQALGYKVFRFTGSEVYSDVLRSASEAIAALTSDKI
jgi:very-short-patch-repair endonuclease